MIQLGMQNPFKKQNAVCLSETDGVFLSQKTCNGPRLRAAALFRHLLDRDWQSLNLYTRHVHRIGDVEFIDAEIKRVYVHDLPGMRVGFDVALELEIEVREGKPEPRLSRFRFFLAQKHEDGPVTSIFVPISHFEGLKR